MKGDRKRAGADREDAGGEDRLDGAPDPHALAPDPTMIRNLFALTKTLPCIRNRTVLPNL